MLWNLVIPPLLVDNLPEFLAVAAAALFRRCLIPPYTPPLTLGRPASHRVVKTAPENAPVPLRPETRQTPNPRRVPRLFPRCRVSCLQKQPSRPRAALSSPRRVPHSKNQNFSRPFPAGTKKEPLERFERLLFSTFSIIFCRNRQSF